MTTAFRHVVVVCRDRPAERAAVRGSIAEMRDEGTVVAFSPRVPLFGGWAPPTRDAHGPVLRLCAWGFWVSTLDEDTQAALQVLAQSATLAIRIFIGPPEGGVHATWKTVVGWIDPPPSP